MLDDRRRQAKSGSRRRPFVRLAACSILACQNQLVSAQSAPAPLPPTREEVTRPLATPPAPTSRLEVEGGIERAPCALDGPEFRSIHVILRGAEFDEAALRSLRRAQNWERAHLSKDEEERLRASTVAPPGKP